mmetsp:Transcript_105194/g.280015  ORF Transcript_105194/g.280015 Transcript_105194/m.280015 type:complete len:178 (-) Transcript_105194:210-743(-)
MGSFFIGQHEVSKPFPGSLPDEFPPVQTVTMKPCVCGGFNELNDESDIPREALAASGLSEAEVRAVMEEVSACLHRRTRCCWGWGYCCCLMPVIWWMDMCTQQCHCGLTKCLCQDPALTEVSEILAKHSEALHRKGCTFELITGEAAVNTQHESLILMQHRQTVYFDQWLIQVRYGM